MNFFKKKVPIIKYTDQYTNFKVDLSFNITGGIDSAQLVKKFMTFDDIGDSVSMMMLVFKQFLAQRHLNEVFTGGLGSYALVVMIVAFLRVFTCLLL